MRDNQFIHKITVVRHVKTGQNSLGEAVNGESSAYISIDARVESYDEKTQYIAQGERIINRTIIYVKSNVEILENDDIYWKASFYGTVIGVNPAVKGTTSDLDHYELEIQQP